MSLIKRSLPEDIDVTDPTVVWEYKGGEPVMKNINVPKRFQSELRKKPSPEYNEAVIRDYIKSHPGEVITGQKFTEILDGLSTAPTIMRKLMKKGKIVRHHLYDGTRGAKYHYTWVDTPTPVLVEPKPVSKIPITEPTDSSQPDEETKTEATVDKLLKDVEWAETVDEKIAEDDYSFEERLDQYFIEYCDKVISPEALVGANAFRQFIHSKLDLTKLLEDK